MQRFHRLGTVGLGMIIAAFTFHLVAISFDRWTTCTCETCSFFYPFREWRTSIRERCYRISIIALLNGSSDASVIANDPFTTYVCIANKYLYPKNPADVRQCLEPMPIGPHNACTSKRFNSKLCQCDYTASTKAITGLAVISSMILGLMVIVAHLTSYVEYDFILKWLLPGAFTSLLVAFVAMFCILIIAGRTKEEDIDEVLRWRFAEQAYNITLKTNNNTDLGSEFSRDNYRVSFGFSYGMEIIAAHFTLSSAIIYALMFLAKKRPE